MKKVQNSPVSIETKEIADRMVVFLAREIKDCQTVFHRGLGSLVVGEWIGVSDRIQLTRTYLLCVQVHDGSRGCLTSLTVFVEPP